MNSKFVLIVLVCFLAVSCGQRKVSKTTSIMTQADNYGTPSDFSNPEVGTQPKPTGTTNSNTEPVPTVTENSNNEPNPTRKPASNTEPKPEITSKNNPEIEVALEAQESMVELIGAHFQSCAPMLYTDKDPKKIIKEFYKDKESFANYKKCRDRRDDDLSYISFSKGSLNPSAGLLQEKNGRVDALSRFQCSGFIAATLASGGMKYYKSQKSRFYSPRTGDITKDFKRSDSCFFKPTLSKKISLLPGDIINVGPGHVIRVFTVGKDPLGLGKIKRKSDCKNIKNKRFNFTIAHSTSKYKSDGKSGVVIEEAKEATTNVLGKLAKAVKKMCEKTFNKGLNGRLDDEKVGVQEIKIGFYTKKTDQIFSLRRHYGSEEKGCTFKLPEIHGGNCIKDQCIREIRESSEWNF